MRQNWNYFIDEFGRQEKDRKKSYQVRQNFVISCNLAAKILHRNSAEGFIVTRFVKKVTFELDRSELGAENCF